MVRALHNLLLHACCELTRIKRRIDGSELHVTIPGIYYVLQVGGLL